MKNKTENPTAKKLTRCAVYTRVSTDQQAEVEFNSCEAQEDRIRSFISSQQDFILSKVYSDPGYTGANTDRPGLQRLLTDVKAGLVDMVFTYKIDRLTRSPRDFYQLIEILEAHHVGYISVTERFDTSTPAGRLLRNIMLTFAQFERELASERIRDKFAQRAKRGLYNGGHPPYGYKIINGRLVPDKKKATVTKWIFETYVQTRSLRQVQNLLAGKGVLSKTGRMHGNSFLWHLLRNSVVTGRVPYKGQFYPGQHPAIVSEELFNHVQKLLTEEPRRAPQPYQHLPFAGLIHCEECGSTMSPCHTNKVNKSGPRKYYYYRCTSVTHHGWGACSTRQISAERFEDIIHKNLLRVSLDGDYLKNHVFALQNKTRHHEVTGIEPEGKYADLTAENLQKSLQNFLKACARKTGIEKTLAVRRGIEKIRYSKKTITIDFDYQFSLDGNCPNPVGSAASALRAVAAVSVQGSDNQKGPDDVESSSPIPRFDTGKLVEVAGIEPASESVSTRPLQA